MSLLSPERRRRLKFGATVAGVVLSIAACEREARPTNVIPAESTLAEAQKMSSLRPGPEVEPASDSGSAPTGGKVTRENPYANNAWGIAQGKRLYNWFNCVGCHAHGGGGMGPPLMDSEWRYGGEADQIYATIVEGRPNGMPSFRMIPEDQIWQLVAYVQSLSGRVRQDAAPGRSDSMHVKKRELAVPDRPIRGEEVPQP